MDTDMKRDDTMSALKELAAKCRDAEKRLGKNFVALFWHDGSLCLLLNKNNNPELFQNSNFFSIAVGASNYEISEAANLINRSHYSIAQRFSQNDFRLLVALDIVTKYLRQELENMKHPRAIAFEYVLVDIRLGILVPIRYSGDFEIFGNFNSASDKIFVLGTYDNEFSELVKLKIKEMKGSEKLAKGSSKQKRIWFRRQLKLADLDFINASDIKRTP